MRAGSKVRIGLQANGIHLIGAWFQTALPDTELGTCARAAALGVAPLSATDGRPHPTTAP